MYSGKAEPMLFRRPSPERRRFHPKQINAAYSQDETAFSGMTGRKLRFTDARADGRDRASETGGNAKKAARGKRRRKEKSPFRRFLFCLFCGIINGLKILDFKSEEALLERDEI